jgi:hypothetical protein
MLWIINSSPTEDKFTLIRDYVTLSSLTTVLTCQLLVVFMEYVSFIISPGGNIVIIISSLDE